eukprot:5155751-Pyramimonas_sp.AAC.1
MPSRCSKRPSPCMSDSARNETTVPFPRTVSGSGYRTMPKSHMQARLHFATDAEHLPSELGPRGA